MTSGIAASPPARRAAVRKRPKPTTLAPLARNQSDDASASIPLDVFFVSRVRRVLRRRLWLGGWDATDADLAVAATATDNASVHTLVLDDCARVTVAGVRAALPVLQAATILRFRKCTSLSSDLMGLLPTTLVEIDLSYCEWLDDHAVRALARRCHALRSVALAHCRRLTDYGVCAFGDVPASTITHFDLSSLPRVTDTGVLALLLRCPKLERLVLSRLSAFEGLNLQGLPRNTAPSLTALDLAHNVRMHFLTLVHLVRVLSPGVLTELDLSSCAQLTDETLVALGRYAPSLRILRVAFCTQLTDAGVTRLVEYQLLAHDALADFVADDAARPRCTQLTTLDLTACFLVTSAGIAAVADQCPNLETLVADGLRRLDAVGLEAIATHCPRFHTLHWSGIRVPTTHGFFSVPTVDRAAVRALGACRALRTLCIAATQCDVDAVASHLLRSIGPQIVDFDASGIATDALCRALALYSPNLETLRLSRSRYFSLDAFLSVATACTKLRTLDLESCEQLRDDALTTLGRHCGATLETLMLSNDWQLTDRGITSLVHRSPRLRRLVARHCPEISPQTLRALATPFVVATRDGFEPKPHAVSAFVAQSQTRDDAARRLGRWWRVLMEDRTHAHPAIERALRHVRNRRRCVVRLQRWLRRVLAHERQKAVVAQALAQRRAQCERHWRWAASYCRLARVLRRLIRQWRVAQHERAFREAEALRTKRNYAAQQIQRVYWGWNGRQRAKERRVEVAMTNQRRLASAQRLQRVWRGHRTRVAVSKQAATQWNRLISSIAAADRVWRAGLDVARLTRGFLGRRRAANKRQQQQAERERRDRSVRQIQRAARAYLVRVLFRRHRVDGAVAMQRVVRGCFGRRTARAVILSRAFTRPPILLLLCRHSIYTRALAIAWKTKRDAAERLALAMQCWFRGYFGGRVVRRQRLALRIQRDFIIDSSARRLQHFFRSLMILARLAQLRAILRRRKRGATTIQSVWRMWCDRVRATAMALRRDRARRHAATVASLQFDSTRRLLLQLGAVHVLVQMYRQSLTSRGWQAPSVVRYRHHCATKIQSLVRGVQTRQAVRVWRTERTTATRVLQRVWRGKRGRKQWRALMAERQRARQLQQEQDRAGRVASKLTSQFVLQAQTTHDAAARVLQNWVRTLVRRQIFQQAQETRTALRRTQATQKLQSVITLATESVVFQARVWRECMDRKPQLVAMEENEVVEMEREVAALKRACLDEYVAHVAASTEYQKLLARKRDAATTSKRLRVSATAMKATIQPFAEQAKQLTVASARVHTTNRQLSDELRVLQRGVAAFHDALQAMLPLEPLLYERDIEALVTRLALPPGRRSMVDPDAN